MPRRLGESSSDSCIEPTKSNCLRRSQHIIFAKSRHTKSGDCVEHPNCTTAIETKHDEQKTSPSTSTLVQKISSPSQLNNATSKQSKRKRNSEVIQANSDLLEAKMPRRIEATTSSEASIELTEPNRRRSRYSIAKKSKHKDLCVEGNPKNINSNESKSDETQKHVLIKESANAITCKDTYSSEDKSDKTQKNIPNESINGTTYKNSSRCPISLNGKSESTGTLKLESASSFQQESSSIQLNARLLEDVIAYIEVRDGNEDHSEACAIQLELLGATIVKSFTRRVTHVFFRNGRKGTYERAKKWKIPLLSAVWIEKCKQDNARASEDDYPAIIPTEYTSPFFFGKIKRFRSMQPKAWKEPKDIVKTIEEREKRKKQYQLTKNYKAIVKSLLSPSRKSSVAQISSPLSDIVNATVTETSPIPSRVATKSPDLLDLLEDEEDNIALSQESTWNVPLVKRIFLQSPALKRIRENDDVTSDHEQSMNSSLLNTSLRTMQLLGLDTDSIEEFKSYADNLAQRNSPQNGHDTTSKPTMNCKIATSPTKSTSPSKFGSLSDKIDPNVVSDDLHNKQKIRPEVKENCQLKLFGDNLVSDSVNTRLTATAVTNSKPPSLLKNVTVRKHSKQDGRRLFTNPTSLLTDIVLASETPERERGTKRSLECTSQGTSNSCKLDGENGCTKLPSRHSLDDFDITVTKKKKTKKIVLIHQSDKPAPTLSKNMFISTTDEKLVVPDHCNKKKRVKKSASRRLIVDSDSNTNRKETLKAQTLCEPNSTAALPSIVTTSVHLDEQETVHAIVQNLGRFRLLPHVDNTTTHVVAGDCRRTLNVLFAIARGCWLVSKEWVFKSMEAERWVDEEPYEMFDAFPTAQLTRLERCVGGEDFSQKLLQDVGPFYVADDTAPSSDRIKELITLTGGKVVSVCRQAKICIGKKVTSTDIQCVAPKWVFDCITENSVLLVNNYLLQSS